MAKFKVSYKMLKEQTGTVAEISKQLLAIADEMEGVASQLDGESVTKGLSRLLRDASANMHGYTDGLSKMGKTMQQIIDKYTKTENNNSKRVDSAKAHNRDFYKNAVSVPSASVGSSGGGGASASATVTVNMPGAAPAAAATTAAPAAGATAFQGGTASSAPGGAVPVAATVARVNTINRTVPNAGGGTGGANAAAVVGAAAAGAAAAGAAVAAGVSKKKKGKAEVAAAAPTSQDAALADAERRLEEAIANANQMK